MTSDFPTPTVLLDLKYQQKLMSNVNARQTNLFPCVEVPEVDGTYATHIYFLLQLCAQLTRMGGYFIVPVEFSEVVERNPQMSKLRLSKDKKRALFTRAL